MPSDQRSASGPQCRMNISGGRNSGVPALPAGRMRQHRKQGTHADSQLSPPSSGSFIIELQAEGCMLSSCCASLNPGAPYTGNRQEETQFAIFPKAAEHSPLQGETEASAQRLGGSAPVRFCSLVPSVTRCAQPKSITRTSGGSCRHGCWVRRLLAAGVGKRSFSRKLAGFTSA